MPAAQPSTRRLILGLGNPGERYRDTRHNLGFRVVLELARRWEIGVDRLECNALIGSRGDLILAIPQTYMNRSGYAARCLGERYGIEPERTLVVYDEVELPLGRLRLRRGGGPGGHRGMESVIQNLRTEAMPRVRLGIRSEGAGDGADLVAFVLSRFEPEERPVVDEMVERAAAACAAWLDEGIESAMNRFNAEG